VGGSCEVEGGDGWERSGLKEGVGTKWAQGRGRNEVGSRKGWDGCYLNKKAGLGGGGGGGLVS